MSEEEKGTWIGWKEAWKLLYQNTEEESENMILPLEERLMWRFFKSLMNEHIRWILKQQEKE